MLPPKKRIMTKKQLKQYLDVELKYYPCNKFIYLLQASEKAILRRHQILLRKTEYHYNTGHKLRTIWCRYCLGKIQRRYLFHIGINCCEIGLHIIHIGNVGISSGAQIGPYCSFNINTFVVNGGLSAAAPTLGQHVVMGIGSVVVGDVKVADYTAVGANAVVCKDIVEENTAVAGAPAKKISNNGSKEWNKTI